MTLKFFFHRIVKFVFADTSKDNNTLIYQVHNGQIVGGELISNVEEFEMMKNYMFATTRMVSGQLFKP